jgi:hypothetical protein
MFGNRVESISIRRSPPNSSQKLTRPGAGPPAEPASQLTRITATRRLQIANCVFARAPRQPPCRVGFGMWAPAVQLRLKPLGRRAQCVCNSIDQSTALRHDYEPAAPRSRRRRRTRGGHASFCHRTSARGSLHVLRAITDRDHERGVSYSAAALRHAGQHGSSWLRQHDLKSKEARLPI